MNIPKTISFIIQVGGATILLGLFLIGITMLSDAIQSDDTKSRNALIDNEKALRTSKWTRTPEGYRYYTTCIDGQKYIIVSHIRPPTRTTEKCLAPTGKP